MKTPNNPLKTALANGELQVGLWLGLASGYAAEVVAGSGLDWLLIDGEHAPNDLSTMLAILQSVAAYPVKPVVRVPDSNPTFIKQVLELGATSLLVPMVGSVEHAREVVRSVRYPPAGVRGVGSGLARSSRFGRYTDYQARANDTICLVVQVETRAAAANAAAIAAVDGVDGVLLGPSDLAASMGLLGQPSHPDVRALIEQTIGEVRGAGKAAGVFCADEALARHYLSVGASLVAVGADSSILGAATTALAQRFKPTAAGATASRDGY